MKQQWWIALGAASIVAGGFWWNTQQNERLELLRQQTEAMRIEAENLAKQSAQLSAESKALQQQVKEEREFAAGEVKRYLNAAQLAEGLSLASRTKVIVVEYFLQQGEWPSANHMLNLPDPKAYASSAVKSMAISHDGMIILTYNETSGIEDGRILLIPQFQELRQDVTWRCQSPDFIEISNVAPQCVHDTATSPRSQF